MTSGWQDMKRTDSALFELRRCYSEIPTDKGMTLLGYIPPFGLIRLATCRKGRYVF